MDASRAERLIHEILVDYENNKKMTAKSNPSIIFTVESGSHKITFENKSGNVTFNSELGKLRFLNQQVLRLE